MHKELDSLVDDIKKIRKETNPVAFAWELACDKVQSKPEWKEFGKLFLSHPDLQNSDNAYHNHFHTSEAIISGAYLAKAEFDNSSHYGPVLIFAMMGHDIAHNGKNNTYDYELELKAVNSMENFVAENPQIKEFWNNNLSKEYGSWEKFSDNIKSIVLNTDFKNGPKDNSSNYMYGNSITQLKMLANEADILPSCISTLGPERGVMLGVEQNNPAVGSWKSREFFLDKLAVYASEASIKLEIPRHIKAQIKSIQSIGHDELENDSLNISVNKVRAKTQELEMKSNTLDDLINGDIKYSFNKSIDQISKLRAKNSQHTNNRLKNH